MMGEWDKMRRVWAMPSADTFDCKPIGEFVRHYLRGISIDPFARNKRWATYTNDLNPNTQAESHLDAVQFLNELANKNIKADCIIFDPPYSPRQIAECYKGIGLTVGMKQTQTAVLYMNVREAFIPLCKIGTVVLSFGWNSCGMGNGFRRRETLLVSHGGAHNDTICVADEMIQCQDMLV